MEKETWIDDLINVVGISIYKKKIRVKGKWCYGNSMCAVQKFKGLMYVRYINRKSDLVMVMEEDYFNRQFVYCEENDEPSIFLERLYGSEVKACRKKTQPALLLPHAFSTFRTPMKFDSFVQV